MKKFALAAIAAGWLAAGFSAHADADCQAGSTWGTKPGCSASVDAQARVYGPSVYNQPPSTVESNPYGSYGYGVPYLLGQVLGNGPYVQNPYAQNPYAQNQYGNQYGNQYYQTPYPRTDRDRDGDGVRNSRDRYPDDPRYH